MSTIQDWPVSQRWIQYKTGQSVKDGYNTQPAGQSTMRFIFNTGLASQFMMGTIQTGQSVHDGYNTVWPVGQRWYNKLTSQSVQDGYNPVWPVGQRWVQQIDRPVSLGPVT